MKKALTYKRAISKLREKSLILRTFARIQAKRGTEKNVSQTVDR